MMMVGKAEVPVIHENVQLQKNFTITRGSIEMLCLHKILESERPDIDEKRNDLLKLQGEFAVQLRELELVSQKYANLAHACSLVYLTLLHLDEVHFLYHYSVDFIIDIFDDVLKNSQLNG
uniref:Dynein heavy chain ATP-binding dynein motor region domain-containing protein n=1 Tax=Panagrolaimus davidi TaxID=227884 RepID=A0A914QQ18_9BILA